ncbi:hypothetical protein SAMN06297387_13132 [Streptomyces zhaozhouensis]|uniref:Uncharacterized protein n=1 Tax=Streptomyces zhaozhouensis TaxID=1300267 RepID=A0A286E998_9ACTN|nr:hypothetical protein [Streptomyces zhaozhouensis]SOD67482.1 hypothetical protein SAMN06297387_13132 [Streptomyces zhaozhouensis]
MTGGTRRQRSAAKSAALRAANWQRQLEAAAQTGDNRIIAAAYLSVARAALPADHPLWPHLVELLRAAVDRAMDD